MNTHTVLELVGYLASALVALSLMMSSIVRLRVINLIGAAAFATYGAIIGAYPVVALNVFLVVVNAYHLAKMARTREYFHILELRPESEYLRYFLDFYKEEIRRLVPNFEYRSKPDQIAVFILRDCVPAGVFIGHRATAGVLHVELDFVIPRYRDLQAGRFLFIEQADYFRARGIGEVVATSRTRDFNAYLRKIGFEPVAAGEPGTLKLTIPAQRSPS